MLRLWKALGLVLLLSVISNLGSVAAQNGDSGCSDRMSPFLLEFAVDSYTKSTGNLTLKVTITYCPETSIKATCDLLTLSVYPVRGLTYTGEDTLQLPYRGENPFSVFFDVIVPPNDTSALIFLWECGFARWDGQCFATTGDTLVTFRASPSFYSDLSSERTMRHLEPYLQKDYERAKREWEEEQERLKHVGRSIRGHLPGWSVEEAARRRSSSRNITMDSLHKLEENPLIEYSAQFIQVGDTLYVRRKGEYKFQVAETYGSREEMQESRRNRKPDPSLEKHIVIDLRKQEDYEFLKTLVDSLIPMEKTGYYHTVTTISVIDKIKQRRIGYSPYPHYPGEIPPPGPSKTKPPRHSRPRGSSSDGQLPAWDLLFYDGFEDAFPAQPHSFSLDYVDGSGAINMVDVTYLVDRLFFGGAPTAPCP